MAVFTARGSRTGQPRAPCRCPPSHPSSGLSPAAPAPRICCLPSTVSYPLPETRWGEAAPSSPAKHGAVARRSPGHTGPGGRHSVDWAPPCTGPARHRSLRSRSRQESSPAAKGGGREWREGPPFVGQWSVVAPPPAQLLHRQDRDEDGPYFTRMF